MAEQPAVTTPGGSDLFAGLGALDYSAFGDDAMAVLVDDNLAHAPPSSASASSPSTTPSFRTGLTPSGSGGTNNNGGEPFLMTPRTADFMAELAATATPQAQGHHRQQQYHHQQQQQQEAAAAAMLFDHDLVTGGMNVGGGGGSGGGPPPAVKEEDEDDVDEDGDALRTDDLPTPLSFSFTPTGGAGGGSANGGSANGPASLGSGGARYHVAAAHKHKRVRSNPDMLQSFNYQQLLTNNSNSNGMAASTLPSPLRPSVGDGQSIGGGGGNANVTATAHGSVSLPTTPLDGNAQYDPLPAPLPISIGTVDVATPVDFHIGGGDANGTGNGSGNGNGDATGEDTFPSDMDSFLKEMQWSELAENSNSMNVDTLSSLGAGYRSQRIQAGVNELKMKRKRPTQHMRHHSNPVDLLHNLDQFRLLSQQQQQQQQHQQTQQQQQAQQQHYTPPPPPPPLPMQYPSPTKLGPPGNNGGGGMMGMQPPPLQQQVMVAGMAVPPHTMGGGGMAMMPPGMQFQVPADIANGSARSLHARRSSMPSTAFARGRGGGHHRRAVSRGSTGLSMDMSQLNLEFLTLPEDEFQQQLQQQREQHAFQQAIGMGVGVGVGVGVGDAFPSPPPSPPLPQNFQQQLHAGAEPETEKNRKSYKCGRCGKPKVGHVCTMPDLRNNWAQVDVEVTKGLKVVRTNCHVVATKNKWVPQHEDHL